MKSLNEFFPLERIVTFFASAFLISTSILAQSDIKNNTIDLENFESINSTINENCFSKLGREIFLLEIDIENAKFFSPSLKISQSVFKTSEIVDYDGLGVEDFYFLLNKDLAFSGAVVSNNLKEYFFSATKKSEGGIKSDQKLQLYEAGIKDQAFSKIRKLPFSTKHANFCHPSISANGNLLIFASDKPGGHGGFDLYAAVKVDGTWSKPFNLGPKVNSLNDELYPFLSNNGYLYFSSDRFGGLGETDIYVSERMDDGWTAAANLGTPFNSKSFDYGFRILNHKGDGTLTSDRSGGRGLDDIYLFKAFDEKENKSLIQNVEKKLEEDRIAASTTNITNNYFTFNTSEPIDVEDKEGIVIYFRAPVEYDLTEYYRNKEHYLNTLEVTAAKKLSISSIGDIAEIKNHFIKIQVRGYEPVYLTPQQAQAKPLDVEFVASGWKHLPGRVLFTDGMAGTGIDVELVSADGNNKVSAKTDKEGKFSSRVLTDQDYTVRLYSDGLQVLETFEFNPMNFDQLILDMTIDKQYHEKILMAVRDIPKIQAATAEIDLTEKEEPMITTVAKDVTINVSSEEVKEKSLARLYIGDENGDYHVIGGTFTLERRAVRRQQLLISKGFTDTKVVKVKGSEYFKVKVHSSTQLQAALDIERAVYKAIEDAYVLRKESKDISTIN